MGPSQRSNFYDVLEVSPDATPQEVREAYLRAKSAYRKDSVAVYTMLTEDETQEILDRIEQAYQTLSSPERRKQYDQRFEHEAIEMIEKERPKNIISIDRVPPMESTGNADDLLVSPPTEIQSGPNQSAALSSNEIEKPKTDPFTGDRVTTIDEEISGENEWPGTFLRRVREARKVSIEDLLNATKISKRYLHAIEDENYSQLPAAVYVRGFVGQMARTLKLPSEKVVNAYMARYTKARSEKEK